MEPETDWMKEGRRVQDEPGGNRPTELTTTGQFRAITAAELARDPSFAEIDPPILGWAARAAAIEGAREAHTRLVQDHRGISWDLDGHVGSRHHAVDVLVHETVERSLYTSLKRVFVGGEEVERAGYVPEGGVVALVDPVDGTWPALNLLEGYATVVLIYRNDGGALAPVAAAVADCTHRVTWLGEDRIVRSGSVWLPATQDQQIVRPRGSGGLNSIAMVGAKPGARSRFIATAAANAGAGVVNLGGTPMIAGILLGELSVAIAPNPQTPWDAAHLLIGAHAGAAAVFLDAPERLLNSEDVIRAFTNPRLRRSEDRKTIPAFAVGHDADVVVEAALTLLASSASTGYGRSA